MAFKLFSDGDVLSATEVNDYMMNQQIMVFDDSTARSAAIVTPTEGMFSYTKDNNKLSYYDGSAWKVV